MNVDCALDFAVVVVVFIGRFSHPFNPAPLSKSLKAVQLFGVLPRSSCATPVSKCLQPDNHGFRSAADKSAYGSTNQNYVPRATYV